MDVILRAEIAALEGEGGFLAERKRAEQRRIDIYKGAKKLARELQLKEADLSESSEEEDNFLGASANIGKAWLSAFIEKIFAPPEKGRAVTPPDARKKKYLKSHGTARDVQRNIDKYYGQITKKWEIEEDEIPVATGATVPKKAVSKRAQ